MPVITKRLMECEPKYGLLYVNDLPRDLFPAAGQRVIIVDEDGESFETKMHKRQSRIDGLTRLHKKHTTHEGEAVTIEADYQDYGKVRVRFESPTKKETLTEEPIPDDSIPSDTSEGFIITPSLESMLEDFIRKNLTALEPGMRIFVDEDGIEGEQYPTDVGPIDLLCLDSKDSLVVIELKRDRDSDRVVGQISRYLGWVEENIAKPAQVTRGIIILHKPTERYPKDDKLYYAVRANPKLELRYYEIALKFYDRGSTFKESR